MSWSLKFGKICGINFRIHITFVMFLVFIFVSSYLAKGMAQAISVTLFISGIFVCVLIHEVAHSLIARKFGKIAKSIIILPIGGVSSLDEMPEKPYQEIAVAIVGPFINLAIALLIYPFVTGWNGLRTPELYPMSVNSYFVSMINVNIILAIFNMIPAFPMDGGRVLRGLFGMVMDYIRATELAVAIGQGLSVFFIFYGIFFNWWLALIGFFLYVGAGTERQQVIIKSVLEPIPVSEVMVTDFFALDPSDPVSKPIEHIYHGYQEDFPVIKNNHVEGLLTRKNILSGIHEKGTNVEVSQLMEKQFDPVSPSTPADEVYRQLARSQRSVTVVVENGGIKGMVSLEGLSNYLLIQLAMNGIR